MSTGPFWKDLRESRPDLRDKLDRLLPVGQHTAPAQCPSCGTVNDAATAVGAAGDVQPGPGDWVICLKCGTILRYDQLLRYVLPTAAEVFELAEESPDGFHRLLVARRLLKAHKGRE